MRGEPQVEKFIEVAEERIEAGDFLTSPDDHPAFGERSYWAELVGHPHSGGHGHCLNCGPATSCLFEAYLDAVIETAVRSTLKMIDEG